MEVDPTKFGRSTFNNEQKSTMSKTGNSALWARNRSQVFENEADLNNKMLVLDEKMNRGFSNSIMERQKVINHIKNKLEKKPDIEELNKQFEEESFNKWSKFLMKQSKQKKYLEKSLKDLKAIKDMKKDKQMEKDQKI